MEKIDAQPVVSFDDLEPFDSIEQLDFEVERYKPFELPQISGYEPKFADKTFRPGCDYESAIRKRSGEPDLEKTQVEAHEQMELLKQNKKDIVSKANVAMPASFTKPLDYSIVLLVQQHPTLRSYCKQIEASEADPTYHLWPAVRERIMPKDEIQLRNVKEDKSQTLMLSKSMAGSFINQTTVPTYDLPGNFGVRVVETMPTDMRTVYIEQHNNVDFGFKCDDRHALVPYNYEQPDQNDYLTDEDSDDVNDFEVKVPELDELLGQFENEDEIIQNEQQVLKEFKRDQKVKGFEVPVRYEIKSQKTEKASQLNNNITKQREQQATQIAGFISDLNESVVYKQNKMFLK